MGCIPIAVAGASRTLGVLGVVGALLLAGCGQERAPVSRACLDEPAVLLSALRQQPPVLLRDGTPLSRCVSAAHTDGELQSLGLLLMRVADMLRAQAASDPDAAFALGYLAGAVVRGAASSSGSVAAQLARRVEQVATLAPGAGAAATAALARGRRAGGAGG